jgi:hypothetical protein
MPRLSFLLALLIAVSACSPSPTVDPPAEPVTVADVMPPDALTAEQTAFLDDLQRRTFDWFWDTTPADNGLTPDRWPDPPFSSIAAVGFALPAYGIGVERGYVTRDEAAERTLNTLRFFWTAPQGARQAGMAGYKGFFYHFLDMETGERYATTELSSIDSALLFAGILFSREYFDGGDADEVAIRAYADSLVQRAEWDWFRQRTEVKPRMGWYPEVDGFGPAQWNGYNEAMVLYAIALGTPTFPLEAEAWDAWTSTYEWDTYYDEPHVQFGPLFGHQYSHLFIDYRGIRDDWMRQKSAEIGEAFDYFENSRRATLSQRRYAVDNPMGWAGYGADVWGLTACDGPFDGTLEVNGEERQFNTYWARGASALYVNDDGTITPTAAGGSIPFAPDETIAALMTMAAEVDSLYTAYGFRDAFNPTLDPERVDLSGIDFADDDFVIPGTGWVNAQFLGIDQGPILIMAENYRTGLVWETIKESPYIVRGLKRAGFEGGWLDAVPMPEIPVVIDARQPEASPTGAAGTTVIVLGSSTAAGTGPSSPQGAWVNRFRDWLQSENPALDVLNLARGGHTNYHILPTGTAVPADRPSPDTLRNVTAALRHRPAAIVVNMPSNGAAAGFGLEEQQRNFETVVAAAEAEGVPVWVTTTQPRNLDAEGRQVLMELRDWITETYGDRAIDFWTGFADGEGGQDPTYDSGDGLHYDDEAHRIFFERVRDAGVLETVMADMEVD